MHGSFFKEIIIFKESFQALVCWFLSQGWSSLCCSPKSIKIMHLSQRDFKGFPVIPGFEIWHQQRERKVSLLFTLMIKRIGTINHKENILLHTLHRAQMEFCKGGHCPLEGSLCTMHMRIVCRRMFSSITEVLFKGLKVFQCLSIVQIPITIGLITIKRRTNRFQMRVSVKLPIACQWAKYRSDLLCP